MRILRLIGIPITIATAALGCTRTETLRLIVPTTYQGHVAVSCIGTMDANATVNIQPTGTLSSIPCPKDEQHIVVIRNGVVLTPATAITWSKTGDGIPVGFTFDVK